MPVELIPVDELWTPATTDFERKFLVKATEPHEAINAAKTKTKKGWAFVYAKAMRLADGRTFEVEVRYDKVKEKGNER